MGTMNTLDVIIIISYFAIMAVLGLIAYRRSKNSDDYFVAGKNLGTFSIAAMWLSSWIGGASIVGTSTDAYNIGVSGMWYVVILAIGTVVFGLTFSKVAKRLGDKLHTSTYAQMLTSRYGSKTGFMVILCCFFAGFGFLASQLVALGSMLNTITSWDLAVCFWVSTLITVAYSALGGLLAITYTTWIQFILIILGTLILGVPLTANAMGGIGQLSSLPPEWFDIGRRGWPEIIALAISTIFSFYMGMDSYTRCFAAKSERVARNGALLAGVGVLLVAFGATFIGLAAKVMFPTLPENSSAYAAVVVTCFPHGVSAIVLVGILAAIMSTGVVSINCCAANVSVDIYKSRINPEASDSSVKRLGIISSLGAGLIGAALAWWKYDIIDLLLMAFTFKSIMFFPTIMGVFWKKATGKAAFTSMIVSTCVVLAWMIGDALALSPVFEISALWPCLLSSAIVFFPMSIWGERTAEDEANAELFFAGV